MQAPVVSWVAAWVALPDSDQARVVEEQVARVEHLVVLVDRLTVMAATEVTGPLGHRAVTAILVSLGTAPADIFRATVNRGNAVP